MSNIFKPYKGICVNCDIEKWIVNSKGQCEGCRYKQNHGGKSKLEVQKKKEKDKPVKVYYFKRTPLKSSKKPLKRVPVKSSNKTQEKRQEVLDKDRETYFKVFNLKPHECEECRLNGIYTPLPDTFEDENGDIVMISQYSHILSKQSHPEYRHNYKNFNRLCIVCHQKYEFGDRCNMKIIELNKGIINKLKL